MDNKERIVLDVAYQPQVRTNMDTRRIMLNVMLALLPALIAATYEFGFKPVLMVAVSMASAVFYEWAYRKLAKKYDENYPNEDHRLKCIAAKHHPNEDGNHRSKYHKLICKGIDELTKIGYEIILSRNFSVQHIGEGGKTVNKSGNNVSPYRMFNKKQGYYKDRN